MIQVFRLKEWKITHFTGVVTEEDVIIGEIETQEYLGGDYGSRITSTQVIELKKELIDILGYPEKAKYPRISDRGASCETAGKWTIRETSAGSNTDRAIKTMRTKHRNKCKKTFTQEVIDELVKRIVSYANRDIKESKRKFIRTVSSSMSNIENDSWDHKDELEELASKRAALQAQVASLESEMKGIMKGEINEWLTKSECDELIKDDILKRSRFKYLPETLTLG